MQPHYVYTPENHHYGPFSTRSEAQDFRYSLLLNGLDSAYIHRDPDGYHIIARAYRARNLAKKDSNTLDINPLFC